jgi:hypothetical protein
VIAVARPDGGAASESGVQPISAASNATKATTRINMLGCSRYPEAG